MNHALAADGVLSVVVCSPLEPEHLDRIRAVDPRVRVLHDPGLIPAPRYTADHKGVHPTLSDADAERWSAMLAEADVAFDFDWRDPAHMPTNAPRLRWVQATSSGIGQFVTKTPFPTDGPVLTTAAGVHSIPLAEFAVMGVLHFVKELPHLAEVRRTRVWERYTTRQLAGSRVLVVGLGHVGRTVATRFAALGVEVVGAGRPGRTYELPEGSTQVSIDEIDAVLPTVDAVVLACPLTPETRNLIDARRLGLFKDDAVLVNIARGGVVDEPALIAALHSGAIGGAALDVFAEEPLSTSSPFWDMDSVIVSPHSASTVDRENGLITDVFVDNLRRYLGGRELVNVYDPAKGY